ncbi:MAG: iron uptake transporter permease EfeU [Nakamurella sp.]
MLATFVIGLREGLEAALIVGIIAAFLTQDGKTRALRSMWIGVGIAVVICLVIGLALTLLSGSLPQRQQEMLETVIGLVAVVMVTWMVLWMRKHSRNLKSELGAAVQGALAAGSTFALAAMAFLAVIREGIETAVFLVAASQTKGGAITFVGAGLGIAVAIVLGWLIYRGGVRINLSKFFRVTGAILVLVAGGVLMSSLSHAHEADWLNVGTQTWIDLSAGITPGSVQESLLAGVLGIRAQLSAISVIAWVLYVVPMLAVVLWPAGRLLTARITARLLMAVGALGLVAAALLALLVPAANAPASVTRAATGDGGSAMVTVSSATVSGAGMTAVLGGTVVLDGAPDDVRVALPAVRRTLDLIGARTLAGRSVADYASDRIVVPATASPATMTGAELAELNGGRYPVGLRAADADQALRTTEPVDVELIITVDVATGLPVGVAGTADAAVIATAENGRTHRVELGSVQLTSTELATTPGSTAAGSTGTGLAAAAALSNAQLRATTFGALLPWMLVAWSGLLLGSAAMILLGARRRRARLAPAAAREATPEALPGPGPVIDHATGLVTEPAPRRSLASSSTSRSGDHHR